MKQEGEKESGTNKQTRDLGPNGSQSFIGNV